MDLPQLTDYREVFRTEHAGKSCTLRMPVTEEPDAAAAFCRLLGALLPVENEGEPPENGQIMQKK